MAGRLIPVEGEPFEDIIDGYFPLQTSLAQMLDRKGFAAAIVTLGHAPIMQIPGLDPNAPVPLNIGEGEAGLIDVVSVLVTHDQMCGVGQWRWFHRGMSPQCTFDPMTRLAEPALLDGIGLGSTEALSRLEDQRGISTSVDPVGNIWGPFRSSRQVSFLSKPAAQHGSVMSVDFAADGCYFVHMPRHTATG